MRFRCSRSAGRLCSWSKKPPGLAIGSSAILRAIRPAWSRQPTLTKSILSKWCWRISRARQSPHILPHDVLEIFPSLSEKSYQLLCEWKLLELCDFCTWWHHIWKLFLQLPRVNFGFHGQLKTRPLDHGLSVLPRSMESSRYCWASQSYDWTRNRRYSTLFCRNAALCRALYLRKFSLKITPRESRKSPIHVIVSCVCAESKWSIFVVVADVWISACIQQHSHQFLVSLQNSPGEGSLVLFVQSNYSLSCSNFKYIYRISLEELKFILMQPTQSSSLEVALVT